MLNKIKQLLILLVSIVVTGCGGGGGGESTATLPQKSTATFQIKAAYLNYITTAQTQNFTLNATVNGINVGGSGAVTLGAPISTFFEGVGAFAKSTTVTGFIVGNGMNVPYGSTKTDYLDSNYMPLGSSGDGYAVVRGAPTLPVTAKVGDTGVWYTADIYDSSTKTIKTGTDTTSYVLEPDTTLTALLSIISTSQDNFGKTSTDIMKFRITPVGALTMVSEVFTEDAAVITINY
jgi:hypothetical protein